MVTQKTQFIIEIDAKGTPRLKGQTKAIKDQTKALKDQDQTNKKTSKSQRQYHQRQEKGVIGVANQTKSFSKMQQTMDGGGGAGGLVRAYALLAANVFALSMAFGVLSRSAQVDTLTESMKTLEIVSGRAIRTLAKDLQEASGYGMDFADSMRATSLALSAGFDSSTVSELAEVARNASVSLGRNMADGLDRIFRGVIKVEPELLDEIGLFVRVREASTKYAAQLGVAATDLTEFQKRQAFANEALQQGKDKFEAFSEVPTDPYAQLAARFSDIAQTLMSMLNTVVSPLINLLTSSKAVLMGVFLGVAAALLKKALPAMGLMTKSAAEQASQARADHQEFLGHISTKRSKEIKASLDKHKEALQAIEDAEAVRLAEGKGPDIKRSGRYGGKAAKAAEADFAKALKIEDKSLRLEKMKGAAKSKNIALDKSSAYIKSRANDKNVEQTNKALATIKAEKSENTKLINKLERQVKLRRDILNLEKESLQTSLTKNTFADRTEKRLMKKEISTAGMASVAGVAETKGMRAGFSQINKEMKLMKINFQATGKGLGTMGRGLFALKAGFSTAAIGAQTLMMALGPIMMVFTLLMPILLKIGKAMGFMSEESKKLSESESQLSETIGMNTSKLRAQGKVFFDTSAGAEKLLEASLAYQESIGALIDSIEKQKQALENFNVSASDAAVFTRNLFERWKAGWRSYINLIIEPIFDTKILSKEAKATAALIQAEFAQSDKGRSSIIQKMIDDNVENAPALHKTFNDINEKITNSIATQNRLRSNIEKDNIETNKELFIDMMEKRAEAAWKFNQETGGALAGKDVIANVNKLPPDTCKDYPHAERGTDFDINGKKKEKTSFITGDKDDDV